MIKYPNDLIEISKDILDNMNELQNFIDTPKDKLIEYHHSLGTTLRNYYNLWQSESKEHPDDISYEYILYVHGTLKENNELL